MRIICYIYKIDFVTSTIIQLISLIPSLLFVAKEILRLIASSPVTDVLTLTAIKHDNKKFGSSFPIDKKCHI